VRDGTTFTGGGVTAGIDFAFTLMKEIAGSVVAQAVQLGIEYDPQPPFDSGSPARAAAEIKAAVEQRYAPALEAFQTVLDRVVPRLRAAD